MTDEPKPKTISIAEVGRILGISPAKAHKKFQRGEIPLEEFIEWNEAHNSHPEYANRCILIDRIDKRVK